MKPVLIIQNSTTGLKLNENKTVTKENKYILEGVFTEFNVKNRNNRIYTATEFVPHVEAMMEKKNWGVVYGEFDHPDVFDISMKYVSHTIESATYNAEKDRIDGEIRLINTNWGKQAQALVDDGLPIFVSSRAAGITEANDHVKLKQLFTYDIVADPGFSSARMSTKPMNESFGFNTAENDFRIYSIPESKMQIFDLSDESKTNELFNMNKNDYVTKKQLTEYSQYLAKQMNQVKSTISGKANESKGAASIDSAEMAKMIAYYENIQATQEKMVKYLDYLSEQVSVGHATSAKLEKETSKIVEYTNYIAENLDKSIDYANYIAENLDKSIDYSNYLAENVDKSIDYSNYIAENLDKSIDYSNYLAENVDKSIDYSNYIAESLDKAIDYSNYIAENVDANIGYTEYLAENVDANIGYTEYLAENVDANINYSEYVAECTDKTMAYADMIAEKLNASGGSMLKEGIKSANQFLITEAEKPFGSHSETGKGGKKASGSSDTKKSVPAGKKTEKCDDDECADDKKGSGKKPSFFEKMKAAKDKKGGAKSDDKGEKKANPFAKKGEKKANPFAKKDEEKKDKVVKESITSKIDTLIAEAKKREASKVKVPAFYAFLESADIKSFETLSDDQQEKAKVVINESAGYYSRQDVLSLVKGSLEKETPSKERLVLEHMPAEIQPQFESLNESEKKSILSQANFYDFKTLDLVEHFWHTRKFNQPMNESKKLVDFSNPLEYTNKLSDADVDRFMDRF